MDDETGVWLYAVTRGRIPPRLTELRGVGGEPVRTVDADDLLAVVSSVSLDEFGEVALKRNLEDLDWLAATARAHDAVVNSVARTAPAVPFRLATLYLGDERVRGLLAGHGGGTAYRARRDLGRGTAASAPERAARRYPRLDGPQRHVPGGRPAWR